jgi:hypothetical protein
MRVMLLVNFVMRFVGLSEKQQMLPALGISKFTTASTSAGYDLRYHPQRKASKLIYVTCRPSSSGDGLCLRVITQHPNYE